MGLLLDRYVVFESYRITVPFTIIRGFSCLPCGGGGSVEVCFVTPCYSGEGAGYCYRGKGCEPRAERRGRERLRYGVPIPPLPRRGTGGCYYSRYINSCDGASILRRFPITVTCIP